jgi:thiol-disulfide isomerase/thioredoxin
MNTRRLLVVLLSLLLVGCGFRHRWFGPRRPVQTEGPILVTPDAVPVTPPLSPQAMRGSSEARPLQLAPAPPRRGLFQRSQARQYPTPQSAAATIPSSPPRLDFERPTTPARPTAPVIQSRPNRYEPRTIETPTRVRQTVAFMPVAEGIVAGQVVDSSGRAQPGATVVAVSSGTSRGFSAEAVADAAGQFELKGLNPNQRYLLVATAPTRTEPLLGRASVTPPATGLTISVARAFTRSSAAGTAASQSLAGTTARPQSGGSTKLTGRSKTTPGVPELPWEPGPEASASRSSRSGGPGTRAAALPAPNQTSEPSDAATAEVKPRTPASDRTARESDRSTKRTGPSGWQPVRDAADSMVALETRVVEDATTPDPVRPLIRPESAARSVAAADAPASSRRKAEPSAAPPVAASARPSTTAPRPAQPQCQFQAGRLVDFELADTRSQGVRFSELGGDLVLIDFWGTWCMPCLRAIPTLNELHQRYGSSGLRVVGVAYEQEESAAERAARVRAVQSQLAVRYPLLLGDESGQCPLKEQFRVGVFPTLILLDRQGREVWRAEGVNPLEFRRLESILQQRLTAVRPNNRA